MLRLITASEEETIAFGQRLAKAIGPGDVVALDGPLGAGKSIVARSLGRALGVTAPLRSPTFVIHIAHSVRHKQLRQFHHLDLYRLRSVSGLDQHSLQEVLRDRRGVTVIEWAERAGRALPSSTIRIRIRILGTHRRALVISGLSSRALKSLATPASASGRATGKIGVPSKRRRQPPSARR